MSADQWGFDRGAGACARCGREFKPGEVRGSALYDEGATLVRRDYCAECWEKRTPGEFSFWRTVVPEPEEEEEGRKRRFSRAIDADTLFDILRDTPDSTDPRKMRFRFVIALMLMRRKKLKLVSIARRKAAEGPGTRDVLVLKRTGRGHKQTFDVADVKMSEEEMIAAQDEVGALLGLGGHKTNEHHGDTESTENGNRKEEG